MNIRVTQDGACWNKEGKSQMMGLGVAVFFDEVYQEDLSLAKGVIDNENGSNNVAEWLACIEAMRIAKELHKEYPKANIKVQSDSQVVTRVFNGEHQTHTPLFVTYKEQAQAYAKGLQIYIEWIDRKFNKEADKLSKEGLQIVKELSAESQQK